MTPEERDAAWQRIALQLPDSPGIDVAAYAAAGLAPGTPVLGLGDAAVTLCVLGRDPGKDELVHRTGFIGAGGRKIRRELFRRANRREPASTQDFLDAGRQAFWVNTVPFKPVGNKAWPERVRQACRPIIADLLVHAWQGTDVLAAGKEALLWFGHDQATLSRLQAHWSAEDAFTSPVDVVVEAPDGASRRLRVHALPHPSPLNATWASRFPGILADCLDRIGWTPL